MAPGEFTEMHSVNFQKINYLLFKKDFYRFDRITCPLYTCWIPLSYLNL